MHGGEVVAKVLKEENVSVLYTLCGGHISPILVAAKQSGIRVIDTRHEVNAVFAADATARLTGIPGVAAVTAGPGITNTITAIKNAELAQVPLVLLGGAAPTLLKGRGALQDIDQLALIKNHVKWATAVQRVRDIYRAVKRAFHMARTGVPGPVFVELPLDLLYEESIVRAGFERTIQKNKTITQKVTTWYIRRHLDKVFKPGKGSPEKFTVEVPAHSASDLKRAIQLLHSATRPVLLVGSGAMMIPTRVNELADGLRRLSVPVFLSGMARGLLGPADPLQFRHHRKEALREADLVILAGVPCDFRLEYGQQISGKSSLVSINRNRVDLTRNRRPTVAVEGDPMNFLVDMAAGSEPHTGDSWKQQLRQREQQREDSIRLNGKAAKGLHPVQLFIELDSRLKENTIIVADGGDFVGTASYILRPRTPLSWLDPGVFGTLGIGGGFASGAKVCRPDGEVILLYGDGSAGYSLMEFDTFVRHRLPVIAIVGNDASWSQIARDQVDILNDDCGTALAYSDYEMVAHAFGGRGRRVTNLDEFTDAFEEARASTREGVPYLINCILEKSDFRKGSLSM